VKSGSISDGRAPVCRSMEQRDLDGVMLLAASATEIQTGTSSPQFWDKEALAKWATSELGVLLVCEVDGRLGGFIIAAYNPISRDGYIHCIVVSSQCRRSGIGETLLARAEKELISRGCNHMFGLVKPKNEASIRLLEKRSFSRGQQFVYWEKSESRDRDEAKDVRSRKARNTKEASSK